MRGVRAKLLRKEADFSTHDKRSYRMENTKAVYLTGERRLGPFPWSPLRYAWGWWFKLYTLIATGPRRHYQDLKKGRLYA